MSKYEIIFSMMEEHLDLARLSSATPSGYAFHFSEEALPFYMTKKMEDTWRNTWHTTLTTETIISLSNHDLFTDVGFIYFEDHKVNHEIRSLSWIAREKYVEVFWAFYRPDETLRANSIKIPFDMNVAILESDILGVRKARLGPTEDHFLCAIFICLLKMLQETREYRVSAIPTYRALRRRHKEIKQSGDINIIYLRRAVKTDKELAAAIGESKDTQRHYVRKHWHRYWCGTDDDRHLEWRLVDTYVRGNVGTPARTDDIYVVNR